MCYNFYTMKIQLETIPVWDGVKSGSECFLCDLMEGAEKHALSYHLGPAIMVPEIRVKMNAKGYCPEHFVKLAEMNKAQALGLMSDTFYKESNKYYEPLFSSISKSSSLGKTKKLIKSLSLEFEKREEGCLVCEMMEDRLLRYIATIALMYEDDKDFKPALLESKGFCIHHSHEIFRHAEESIRGDTLNAFLKDITALLETNLKRVNHDIWWLTQKYKSENKDKDWDGCEDAAPRGVQKMVGKGRIIKGK